MTTYFATLASVAGTLVALLFLSVQLRVQSWSTQRIRRTLAEGTLLEFLTPTMVALSALGPPLNLYAPLHALTDKFGRLPAIPAGLQHVMLWQIAAWFFAAAGLITGVQFICTCLQDLAETRREHLLKSFVVSWPLVPLEYGSLALAAGTGNQDLLAVVLIWLVFSGAVESWWIFIERPSDGRQKRNPNHGQRMARSPHVTPGSSEPGTQLDIADGIAQQTGISDGARTTGVTNSMDDSAGHGTAAAISFVPSAPPVAGNP